jgi:hypothetical protein
MQVRTTIEVTQDVLVEVSLDDVMAEISALETPERVQEALRLLSLCMGAVIKVPDTLVAEMNAAQKKVIADALREQLARYEAP